MLLDKKESFFLFIPCIVYIKYKTRGGEPKKLDKKACFHFFIQESGVWRKEILGERSSRGESDAWI